MKMATTALYGFVKKIQPVAQLFFRRFPCKILTGHHCVELEIGLLPNPFDPPVGDDAVFGDIGCSALHGGAPVGVDKGAVVRVDDGEKGFMTQGGAFGQAEDPIIFQ